MVKRRKKRLKFTGILIIILLILLISIPIIYKDKIKNYYLSKVTGYSEDTVEVFVNNDINIKDYKYSKTLESIINTKYFNKKYLKEYENITYIDNSTFLSNISSLLDLGYKSEEINTILSKLNSESIKILIDNNYIKDINNILSLDYFKEDYLSRYIKYISSKEIDTITAITYVNIGLDNDYYTNTKQVNDSNDILVIVNKYNRLESNYVPKDLTTIKSKFQWYGRENQLRSEATSAFEQMCEKALNDNIYLYAGSGYRSYATQLTLYNNYVKRDGFKEAETYSARAGYSEHQTGLAMDIANKNGFINESDKEYTWLINNSYKYGYILRYPKGKEFITGYMYEEWHYRYVGIDIATKIHELNITYDEYVAKFL